jgi:hypothetical protein
VSVSMTIHTDWPVGTSVGAYRTGQLVTGQSAPVGGPVSIATVDSLRRATITGLEAESTYALYANFGGADHTLRFTADEAPPGGGGGTSLTVLDEDLVELPARDELQVTGGGILATDDGSRTVIRVVDEAANPLDPRFAGGASTDGVSDCYAALNAAVQAAAGTEKGRIFIPPYTFRTSQAVVVNTNSLIMQGAGARRSRIQLLASVDDDVFRFHTGGGAAFSSQGEISGIAFCTTQGGIRSDGNAGLVLDAVQHVEIRNCYAFGNDIGFDMRNNCYGSRLTGCVAHAGENRVGLLLRGATPLTGGFVAGSGSDIVMLDNWFGGADSAIWMEPNAGGYHVIGGQLTGGWFYGSTQDANGTVVLGRGYKPLTTTSADVSAGATTIPVTASGSTIFFSSSVLQIGSNKIAYTGRTGDINGGTITGVSGVAVDIPSGTPIYLRGAVAQVELNGVSFEGTDKRHAIRAYEIIDGLSLNDCSVNSNGANRIMSVIKGTDCKNSVIAIRRSSARGIFSAALPLDLQGLSGSWDVVEESPNVVQSVSFNGVGMNFQTQPMIERSSLGSRSRAFFGDKVRFGGRTMRWNGSNLESNTDSSAAGGWASLGGGGTVPDQLMPYTRPGVLVVEGGTARMRFPADATIVSVAATVNTAPTGASIIVDVNKNGTTVFTTQANRPTIAAAGTASGDQVPAVTAIGAGDYLTVDIDQVGSTTPGADLAVVVRYH